MTKTTAHQRILLVDDDVFHRKLRSEILTRSGYDVYPATDYEDALFRCKPGTYDLVLVSGQRDEKAALEFCQKVRSLNPEQIVIVLAKPFAYIPDEACPDDVVTDGPRELLATVKQALSAGSAR